MKRYLWILIAGLTVATSGSLALAQNTEDGLDPMGGPDVGELTPGPADEPADELEGLLEGMSPEELEKLISEALVARLQVERQQVAAEIEDELLYDPADVKKALAILKDNPKNTQADNIERIMKAYATADPDFGKAHRAFQAGKYDDCIAALKKSITVDTASYLIAAKYMLQADALLKSGKVYLAGDLLEKILAELPERISFAAEAGLKAARAYDDKGRGIYAMEMYTYVLRNYGLTMDKKTLEKVSSRLDELTQIYAKPMDSIAKLMDEVEKRLDKADSGKVTQDKQEQIVMVLEDLIKYAEEKAAAKQQPPPSSGQGQQGEKENSSSSSSSSSSGQQPAGSKPGDPKGTQQPSSPAMVSKVVPGRTQRPGKLSEVRDTGESGDWANLPPREREKLEEASRKVLSDTGREASRDYSEAISGSSSRGE